MKALTILDFEKTLFILKEVAAAMWSPRAVLPSINGAPYCQTASLWDYGSPTWLELSDLFPSCKRLAVRTENLHASVLAMKSTKDAA
jgi:hypothetical protein